MEYSEYLNSDHWKYLKEKKAKRKKRRCSICAATKNIDCHHLNYKDLHDVETSDLRWLCRRCHSTAHELMKSGVIIFKNDNHHSRFAITKHQVKYSLGLINKNMFYRE